MHSGHVAFLQQAARKGEVYVSLGSDETMRQLKHRNPLYGEEERLFMVAGLASVKYTFIASGTGVLDFEPELRALRPDIFLVNEDGDDLQKRVLCTSLGIEYLVMKREPHHPLPFRSSETIRDASKMPYRLDLAGGWLDQPYVSKYSPGPVITISLEPTQEFDLRSGMATSTRSKAISIWGSRIPAGNPVDLAKILFACDNPPGTKEIAGSQDAIGIVLPHLNCLWYGGEYWPKHIESVKDDATLNWLERHLRLVKLKPRKEDFRVLDQTNITPEHAIALSQAAQRCYQGILEKDIIGFGRGMRDSFEAQVRMFPLMTNPLVQETIEKYRETAYGWKLSGAGGGGYLVLATDLPLPDAIPLRIRRVGF